MGDRFDEMAERVQFDIESYAMRNSIDGRRRVIADALRAAHARGLDEMSAERDARPPMSPEDARRFIGSRALSIEEQYRVGDELLSVLKAHASKAVR